MESYAGRIFGSTHRTYKVTSLVPGLLIRQQIYTGLIISSDDPKHPCTKQVIMKFVEASPDWDDPFPREGALLQQVIGCQFIVQLIDVLLLPDDHTCCIIMEEAPMGNLYGLVRARGTPLSEREAQVFTVQILFGLMALHFRAIIHYDIKPQNILVFGDWPDGLYVKIGDLGSARQLSHVNQLVAPGVYQTSMGTAAYRAPEVAESRGHKSLCDLWSVGLVIF
jgi:serine/threonine protein kinase